MLFVVGYSKPNPDQSEYIQTVNQHTNNCSYLELANNWYHDNFAENGGAILYSSDNITINVTCSADQGQSDVESFDCGKPMWTNNKVGQFGYSSLVAFPPASLQTSLPPSVRYVSNGDAKLPMSLHAVDVRGSQITKGWQGHCYQLLLSDRFDDIHNGFANVSGYAAHACSFSNRHM